MGTPAEMGRRRPGERASTNFSATCRRLSQYLREKGGFGELSLGMTRRVEGMPETLRTLNLLPGVEAPAAGEDDGPAAEGDAVSEPPKPGPSPSMDLSLRRPSKVPDLNRDQQRAQMTIFYGGKVVVFDNFPADRARELMDMAGRVCPSPVKSSPNEKPAAAPVAPPPPPPPPQRHPSCPPPPAQHQPSAATATLASTSETRPLAGAATADAAAAADAASASVEPEATQNPPAPASSDLPIARRVSLHRFLEKRKDRITTNAPYQVNTLSAAAGPSSASPAKGEDDGRRWLGLAPHASKPEDDNGGSWQRPTKPTTSGRDQS